MEVVSYFFGLKWRMVFYDQKFLCLKWEILSVSTSLLTQHSRAMLVDKILG